MIETRIDSGIEMATISVLRQLPRKSRIIEGGEARRRSSASRTTPCDRGADEERLIEEYR